MNWVEFIIPKIVPVLIAVTTPKTCIDMPKTIRNLSKVSL